MGGGGVDTDKETEETIETEGMTRTTILIATSLP